LRTIEWHNGTVKLIDQRQLPHRLVIEECTDHYQIAQAIKEMHIRGAPAIGVAAAFGLALVAFHSKASSPHELLKELEEAALVLRNTRPTAVNLFWALDRVLAKARSNEGDLPSLKEAIIAEALLIAEEDVETNKKMGAFGATLIKDGYNILTHCNTGALATVDYGTALGAIRTAWEQGKRIHVWVDETRPRLQGARLTAWELKQLGIPATLIADNVAGLLMRQGKVDIILVGADRIAANGDVANKIGTYNLAVLAHHHGIPFYSVAPTSTIDLSIPSGEHIPIEERDATEVSHIEGIPIAPEGFPVYNPAFDVTPHRLITGIVTEKGIVYPPFDINLRRIVEDS
jgi:methylthioribose-1-phosphate isomerase